MVDKRATRNNSEQQIILLSKELATSINEMGECNNWSISANQIDSTVLMTSPFINHSDPAGNHALYD